MCQSRVERHRVRISAAGIESDHHTHHEVSAGSWKVAAYGHERPAYQARLTPGTASAAAELMQRHPLGAGQRGGDGDQAPDFTSGAHGAGRPHRKAPATPALGRCAFHAASRGYRETGAVMQA